MRRILLVFLFPLLIFSSVLNNLLISQNQQTSPLMYSYQEHTDLKSISPFGLEWIHLGPTLNGARVEAIQ